MNRIVSFRSGGDLRWRQSLVTVVANSNGGKLHRQRRSPWIEQQASHGGELLQQLWTSLFQCRVCSPLKKTQRMTFYVDDELSDVDHPSPLSTSEVFGTIVVLFLGVVSMLSQQKDSSSRDFPPPPKTASLNAWQLRNVIGSSFLACPIWCSPCSSVLYSQFSLLEASQNQRKKTPPTSMWSHG